jgi:hypothetical protein
MRRGRQGRGCVERGSRRRPRPREPRVGAQGRRQAGAGSLGGGLGGLKERGVHTPARRTSKHTTPRHARQTNTRERTDT